jgi:hypothetical protein
MQKNEAPTKQDIIQNQTTSLPQTLKEVNANWESMEPSLFAS